MGTERRFAGGGSATTICWMVAALVVCGSGAAAQPGIGQDAKLFTLETLAGGQISLSDYLGKKPVLLTFISISCFECDETIPVVARVIDKYQEPGGLQVLFVALANRKGAQWIARSGKYDVRAPLLIEKVGGGLLPTADDYGVLATPSLFLIGSDGKIAWQHMGRVSFDMLDAEIGKHVARNR